MSESFPTTRLDRPLRIAFFGTPEFAATCMREIYGGKHEIVAVITSPDKKAGRGHQMRSSEVKKAAVELGLPIHQPTNLKSPEFVATITGLDCDLAVVVAFRMLPQLVWDAPRFGSINLHASLLPQLRGAAPIQWAIRHKLTETGVTTFSLQQAIDTGDILLQAKVAILPSETAATLHDKLLYQGKQLLAQTLEKLANGQLKAIPQHTMEADSPRLEAPKLNRTNCRIDWSQNADSVEHMIRSLNPYPSSICGTPWGDFKVLTARLAEVDFTLKKPGEATIHKDRLFVACQDRWLELMEIVPNGKRSMEVKAWINGLQPSKRETLGDWS